MYSITPGSLFSIARLCWIAQCAAAFAATAAGQYEATLSNCLFYNNSSAGGGGAIAASAPPESASVRSFNCTFFGNTAAGNTNGRTGCAANSELQYISLFNCIAWGNTPPQCDRAFSPASNFN